MVVTWLLFAAIFLCHGKPQVFPLEGTWDVVHVLVDRRDQLQWGYRPDDPQLVGRELTVTPALMTFDGDDCLRPAWSRKNSPWKTLLRKTFSRPPRSDRAIVPSPDDFELEGPASRSLVTYLPRCRPARAHSRWGRDWFVIDGPNKIFLSDGGTGILRLERRPPGAKPRPSFDCSKATTLTERTICASFPLAAWDRSVAAGWQLKWPDADAEKKKLLKAEQAEYLKERDACGADVECLDSVMRNRTGVLSSFW